MVGALNDLIKGKMVSTIDVVNSSHELFIQVDICDGAHILEVQEDLLIHITHLKTRAICPVLKRHPFLIDVLESVEGIAPQVASILQLLMNLPRNRNLKWIALDAQIITDSEEGIIVLKPREDLEGLLALIILLTRWS